MAKLFIENNAYEVPGGKNLLEVCLSLGMDLPYFCWHPALGSVGACRQCAIKVYKDENDKKGKLIMSCMEPVTDNQRISIVDPEANEFRENVIGWLMTNHPHDCAVCDEGGSCHLQDMTVMTGHAYRKFNFNKRTYRNQDLGPFLNHEMNRCIQCYRCVRFYKDYAGGRDLDAFASRNKVYFGRSSDGALENEFSGNLAEVCPTGVFTDKTLKQHYTRKWDLTMAPSICQHCSLGCNTIAGERYGSLRMIGNRYHGEINGYFLCDRGRFGYEFVNAPDRVRAPLINGQSATRDQAVDEISMSLKNSKVIGIGSPRASLESNFALKELVGKDNFYHGVSDRENKLAALSIKILEECTGRVFTMKDVEGADAVFILGEDITNTAPMMALAVRQAVRNQPMAAATKAGIHDWNDAAVREIVQTQRGPLFIAGVRSSKLDDIAEATCFAAPSEIARLGAAVANELDSTAPSVPELSKEQKELAKKIAASLSSAKKPAVITGTSIGSDAILKAAANVAIALQKKNKEAGIVIALPECNSMGLALMGGGSLSDAFRAVNDGRADTVIVLENDLYRRDGEKAVNEFFQRSKRIIVIDHTSTKTVQKAHFVFPAGTFAESDGTIVNNEGRAQRFFQVHEASDSIQESWSWLAGVGVKNTSSRMGRWKNFEDVTKAVASEEPNLKGVERVTPPADFRIAGQRIPREPHRYSGRTAMNANIAVSEPKPPDDDDSSLSYTMEGFRGQPPSSMIPFFWSPGWNSVQSVNKYQEEVGGHLRGGDPGVRLIESRGTNHYLDFKAEAHEPRTNQLLVVWLHHIFGSEELSARSEAVSKRIPEAAIALRPSDASALGLAAGQKCSLEVDGQVLSLQVVTNESIPAGVAGVPSGLPGMHHVDLPAAGTVKK